MCIIVAKEKGIEIPSKETLKTCFERNSDGAGFMYVKDNKVIIDKGYMDFDTFYKRLQKLDKKLHFKDKALVMHFRIGTHGNKDKATTHPFPITNDTELLKKTYVSTDIGMAHNGIIPHFDYEKDLSDTQLFIRDVVSVAKDLNKNFYKKKSTLDMFNRLTTSKLCFLDTKENLIYVGDFVKDENGVRYSNNTYESYKPITYSYYDYDYDYDYDWGYEGYYKTDTKTTTTPTLTDTEDDFYDDYEDDFDYSGTLVEEFAYYNNYKTLTVGDCVEFRDGYRMRVGRNEVYLLTKTNCLYEYTDNYVSLIATGVKLLDDYNDFGLKGCEA